ncbi:MAG: DUF4347 domain-containing protein, partial [Gallionella sp.]|nr:DUF4347 domain-containing protein [Gallionella sp.]
MAIIPLRPYQSLTTIVFIDGALPDLQAILSGLDPSVTAIVLDPALDGIQQMADALVGASNLSSIHVISHGSSGHINLGAAQLSQDTLAQYQTQLATIGQALSATGDLLLYGCNVAQGIQGQAFISALSAATGADVAASTDLTGAAFLGGDWTLEVATGVIEANALQADIAGVLPANTAPSFMVGDGKVTTVLGIYGSVGHSVTVQSDGKILVAGTYYNIGMNDDFALVRYNSDGSLDTTFDTDGKLITNFGSTQERAYSVIVQADGKILMAGSNAIVRYNTNGSLDTTFDSDGRIATTRSNSEVTVQADGKILAEGTDNFAMSLGRYNSDGSIDTTFDGDGNVGSGLSNSNCVELQADGKILVAGTILINSIFEFGLVRYNSDGSFDTTFDGDSMTTTNIGFGNDYPYDIAVQADGKILLAGGSSDGTNLTSTLVRYNADGSLDTTFSGDGKLPTAFVGSFTNVAVQSDGKILAAGNALVRYNSDGSLDTTFDADGFTTSFGSAIYSVAVQTDGKILVTGGTGAGITLARYNTDGSLDATFGSTFLNTLNGTPSYTENGSVVVLGSNAQIVDSELVASGSYAGATLTLARDGGANSQDVFSATGTLGILTQGGNLAVGGTPIGTVTSNAAGTLVLTFNSNATQSLVNSAMQKIAYSNSSNTPPASVQINWTFSDGNTGAQGSGGVLTTMGYTAVSITNVIAAPTIAAVATDDIINASEAGSAITGTNESGATVALSIGGNTRAATVSGTNWSYTLVAADITAMGQGAETLSATQTDAAGNTSAAGTRAITVDTAAPATPTITAVATDDIINAAEAGSAITGTNESGATVALSIGGNTRAATVSGTSWSYTLVAADITAMGQGAETLSATQTDAAGNTSAAGTRAITVDTVALAPTIATVATDDIINASEAGSAITGTNESGATVALSIGGNTSAATVTGTNWSYTLVAADITAMGQGAETLSATQTDAAGNTSAAGTRAISVDTSAPAAPTINAVATNDIINASEQTTAITGTNESGATVALSIGGNTRAATVSGTNWSYTLVAADITAMGQGAETLSATQTDAAGNTSAAGTRNITVDTAAPAAPTIAAVATNDIINASEQTSAITGTNESGATVAMSIGGNTRAATVSGTNWSYTLVAADITAMGQGAETLSATQTDAAGNTSAAGTRNITVDTAAPSAPTIAAVATNDIINAGEQTAAITGTNESGATVALTLGGNTRAATVSGTSWSYTLIAADITAMGQGAETLSATQTDAAGNTSAAGTRNISVDTSAPVAPVINAVATDDTINAGEQTTVITGTNESGATVALSIGGNTRAATVSGTSWSYTLVAADITAMGQGAETLSATQTDAAGNISAATRAITVDTVAPTFSSGTTATITENTAIGSLIYDATADGDSGVLYSFAGGADVAKFSINTTNGQASFSGISPDYEIPVDFNGNNVYDFTVRATDTAGNTTDQAVAITITNVNDAPSFLATLNGAPSCNQGGAAVVLDADAQIFDAELSATGNYGGASITLARNGSANAQDIFSNSGTLGALTEGGSLVVGGTTIGTVTTNSGGTLTLTFNSSATQSLSNSAMQQIAYSNSADAPSFSAQIDWTFNDGNSGVQGAGGALAVTGSTTVSVIQPIAFVGGAGNDVLVANSANNVLDGSTGTNTLTGGAGVDTFVVRAEAVNTITDFTPGVGGEIMDVSPLFSDPSSIATSYVRFVQSGSDTLFQYDQDGVAGNVYTFQTITIVQGVSATSINAHNFNQLSREGTASDDVLIGGLGVDTIAGGAGNDVLNGVWGDDNLVGGTGDDTYYVYNTGDQITEGANEGVADKVIAAIDYSIASLTEIEDLDLGVGATSGTGNDKANKIRGNESSNHIDGGQGGDRMEGGHGADTYYVDSTGDDVFEADNTLTGTSGFRLALDLGSNIDKVIASISYTLGNYLENLNLATGSGNINATGNTLVNVLTGNSGGNTLTGAGGNDTFVFAANGNGIDTITDFSAGDSITVTGAAFSGTITAGDGSSVMANQIQLVSSGGTTTLYIGTDSTAGADVQIQLTGTFAANAFASYGNTIALNSTPTGSVTITGVATQGQTFTAANTLADADGLGAISYQWKANGANLSGATNSTYTLNEGEVGKTITVSASYTDLH